MDAGGIGPRPPTSLLSKRNVYYLVGRGSFDGDGDSPVRVGRRADELERSAPELYAAMDLHGKVIPGDPQIDENFIEPTFDCLLQFLPLCRILCRRGQLGQIQADRVADGVDAADLVTEMTKVKHPMDAGRKGQKGIEW